ncbi:MAG: alpha-amylase family glycosyl hydrolase [Bryobacteraceae bacterium]
MPAFPKNPVIYEINTFVWLQQLSGKYGRRIDLTNVPSVEWDAIGKLECDAVWLMGVWQRSPAGRKVALGLPDLISEFGRILPGFTADDIPGSGYSIKAYEVDERLGSVGEAREQLRQRGLKLILDFVPNHVATDHAWVTEHPEYFVQASERELAAAPENYFSAAGNVLAYGRDPYFPPWTDTAQVNAFAPGYRRAALDTLREISTQCDGVRCDMAMLLLTDIFKKTWGDAAGAMPKSEYWTEMIQGVRRSRPDFLFIAEAYWDLEWNLQQLGFDYCYDKRLYDRLIHDDAAAIRAHLGADLQYQNKLIRFLENHDEKRAAAALAPARHRAAAVAIATLAGAILYYDGQFCGSKLKIPVQLGRAPAERCDESFSEFYSQIRRVTKTVKSGDATWKLCPAEGWSDNETAKNLLSWCWEGPGGRFLVVINFAGASSQGRVRLPWANLAGKQWRVSSLVGSDVFERDGTELRSDGFYVGLEPWQYYVLQFEERVS